VQDEVNHSVPDYETITFSFWCCSSSVSPHSSVSTNLGKRVSKQG